MCVEEITWQDKQLERDLGVRLALLNNSLSW
jgi:hypothetical protein